MSSDTFEPNPKAWLQIPRSQGTGPYPKILGQIAGNGNAAPNTDEVRAVLGARLLRVMPLRASVNEFTLSAAGKYLHIVHCTQICRYIREDPSTANAVVVT